MNWCNFDNLFTLYYSHEVAYKFSELKTNLIGDIEYRIYDKKVHFG